MPHFGLLSLDQGLQLVNKCRFAPMECLFCQFGAYYRSLFNNVVSEVASLNLLDL